MTAAGYVIAGCGWLVALMGWGLFVQTHIYWRRGLEREKSLCRMLDEKSAMIRYYAGRR